MAFNFPNSPTVGQKYPTSPGPGVPQYTWNGVLWTTHGVAPPGPGLIPVYTDGSTPMTGQLTLVGDPVNPTHAADKHYVDNHAPMTGSVRYDAAQSLTGGQQTQAQSNIGFSGTVPVGTVMLFYQASAPVGWTQVTTQNDKALRVVSGSGGVAGGTNPFSTVMAQTAIGNHTLALAELPTIQSKATNTITTYIGGGSTNYVPYETGAAWNPQQDPGGTGTYYHPITTNGSISYASYGQFAQNITVNSLSTTGGAHNHPITMQIQYCDVILCSKN